MSNPFIIYKLSSRCHLVTMVSFPGNKSDLLTSPCEDFALYFSDGVVVVLPCIHLVVLSTSDCPLAKVRASPDIGSPPDNKKDGYIIGGGVATFTENVTGQVKQDILNAILLAQLVATKKYVCERSCYRGLWVR